MALLTKAAILGTKLRTKEVPVPEWGGEVRIVELPAAEREVIETAILEARGTGEPVANVRARYAAACIVDAKGNRLFSEVDIEALGRQSGAALARVHTAIIDLNLLDGDAIEEAAKN